MRSEPASPEPGPDEDPARSYGEPWPPIESIDDAGDWEALLDSLRDPDEPLDPDEEYDDPETGAATIRSLTGKACGPVWITTP